MDFKLTYSF